MIDRLIMGHFADSNGLHCFLVVKQAGITA